MKFPLPVALVCIAFTSPCAGAALEPHQQLLRDVYTELVGIDTTTATGDTLQADPLAPEGTARYQLKP